VSADSAHDAMFDTLGIVDPQISEWSRQDCERSVHQAISEIKKAIDESIKPECGRAALRLEWIGRPKKDLIAVAKRLASDISELKSISALGSKVSGGQTTEQSLPDYIGCFEEEFNLAWSRQIIQALPTEDTGVFCRLTRKSGTSQETQTSAKDELKKLLEMMKSDIAEQQRQYEVLRRTITKQSSKSSDRDSLDGAATPIWLEFTGKGPSASEYPTDNFEDSSMEAS